MPLHRLLGRRARSGCPSTLTAGIAAAGRPRTSPRGRARWRREGFRGLKFDPFGTAHGGLDAREEALSLEIVAAVREAVGPGVEVMIEAHDRFDVPTAIRVGRALEPYRIAWYEAPVLSTDLEALARVASAVPVPVAAGERLSQPADFARLGQSRTVLIWQPETLSIGGVSGIQQVSGHRGGLRRDGRAPQRAGPGLHAPVNAHLAAWLPNLRVQEYFVEGAVPMAFEVLRGAPRAADGVLTVPDGPGLGVELDEAAAARYPYRADHFHALLRGGLGATLRRRRVRWRQTAMTTIRLPWGAWYGDETRELPVPDRWRVTVPPMPSAPALSEAALRRALATPIGSPPLRELARGKQSAAIVVDDLTRPTPASVILPLVLDELRAGGIEAGAVRVLLGFGGHRALGRPELLHKLGPLRRRAHRHQSHALRAPRGVRDHDGGHAGLHQPLVRRGRAPRDDQLRGAPSRARLERRRQARRPGLAGIETIAANHRPGHLGARHPRPDDNAQRRGRRGGRAARRRSTTS